MIRFKYKSESSVKTGNIKLISSSFPIEADIQANGWSFHIIVGKYRDGSYICIPNWSIGSELSDLNDSFWNSERLTNYTSLSKANADIIAAALVELSCVT